MMLLADDWLAPVRHITSHVLPVWAEDNSGNTQLVCTCQNSLTQPRILVLGFEGTKTTTSTW